MPDGKVLTAEDIENRFNTHAPSPAKGKKHDRIRQLCKELATELNEVLPLGRETAVAFTKLEEVMFWANASVARNGFKGN